MNDGVPVPTQHPESVPPGIDLAGLLAKVRAFDEEAARVLVEWLHPIVRPVVRGNLPRREDFDDLMQEIHLKIFSRLDQYRGQVPFEHWVRRLALNTCFDRLRRQRARPEVRWSDLSEAEVAVVAQMLQDQPEAEAAAGDAAVVVERLLAKMSAQEAWLIRKLDLEERSIAEVCAETGWNGGVARIRAFRARGRLRKLFKELEKWRP